MGGITWNAVDRWQSHQETGPKGRGIGDTSWRPHHHPHFSTFFLTNFDMYSILIVILIIVSQAVFLVFTSLNVRQNQKSRSTQTSWTKVVRSSYKATSWTKVSRRTNNLVKEEQSRQEGGHFIPRRRIRCPPTAPDHPLHDTTKYPSAPSTWSKSTK